MLDDKNKVIFGSKGKYLSAETEALGNWFNKSNNDDKIRTLNLPIIGLIIRGLGLK